MHIRHRSELIHLALAQGATQAAVIDSHRITVKDELAQICREPGCPNYGCSGSCPPHVSGPDGFRDLLTRCPWAVVVKVEMPAEILMSADRPDIMRLLHVLVATVEKSALRLGYAHAAGFAGSACKELFCNDRTECRVVNGAGQCRHPDRARPSMSGFGVDVAGMLAAAGWPAVIGKPDNGSSEPAMSWVAGVVLVG